MHCKPGKSSSALQTDIQECMNYRSEQQDHVFTLGSGNSIGLYAGK